MGLTKMLDENPAVAIKILVATYLAGSLNRQQTKIDQGEAERITTVASAQADEIIRLAVESAKTEEG